MSNLPVFDLIESAPSESAPSESAPSMALLALKRFCRRLVKQVGVGAIAFFLMMSIATHSSSPQTSEASLNTVSMSASISVSMPVAAPLQPAAPTESGLTGDVGESASRRFTPGSTPGGLALSPAAKPFQTLRPKMTHHRLTTSRLSIPTSIHPTGR